MTLPNFVLIGAMRSGSTSLYKYLQPHPDVFMPRKEIHFFDRKWDRGLDWYRSRFDGYAGQAAIGEATPTYLAEPLALERMAATIPGARLIAVLRDPVDRAYSHYWMEHVRGRDQRTFEQAVADELAGRGAGVGGGAAHREEAAGSGAAHREEAAGSGAALREEAAGGASSTDDVPGAGGSSVGDAPAGSCLVGGPPAGDTSVSGAPMGGPPERDASVSAPGSDYLGRGRYARQLAEVTARFPRSALHVVLFDDLRDRPADAYASACRFLGIDDGFVPPRLGERVNRFVAFRSMRVRNARRRLPSALRIGRIVGRLNARDGGYPPMDPATRAELRRHFAADDAALADWLGRDLPW